MTERYWLSSHVSLCRTDDYIVLMDTRRNQYLGANAEDMQFIGFHIEGWPWDDRHANLCQVTGSNGAKELLEQLLNEGLLRRSPTSSKRPVRPDVTPSATSLIEGYTDGPSSISMNDIINFLRAVCTASIATRLYSFESLVQRLQNRATLRAARGLTDGAPDERQIRQLVSRYAHLRPLLFRAAGACLFNSVALSEYLARYGVYTQFVFGVRTGPFSAHCWLQLENTVVGDTAEYVGSYTPILAL